MIEHLDDEILVCDSSHGIALQITGEAADVLRQFEETGSLEGAPEEVVADLVKAGVLVPAEDGAGLSRRVLLASGVGVVGGGIMALALPAATAAASGGGGGGDGSGGLDPSAGPDPTDIVIFDSETSDRFTIEWFSGDPEESVTFSWVMTKALDVDGNELEGLTSGGPDDGSSRGSGPSGWQTLYFDITPASGTTVQKINVR